MSYPGVNIDFDAMRSALKRHVWRKALLAGSDIIYVENGNLIEENPKAKTKKVLKVLTRPN